MILNKKKIFDEKNMEESEKLFRSKFEIFYPYLKIGFFLFDTVSIGTVILCRQNYIYHNSHSITISRLYIERVETGWKIFVIPYFESVKEEMEEKYWPHQGYDVKKNYDIDAREMTHTFFENISPSDIKNLDKLKKNYAVKLLINLSKKYIKLYSKPNKQIDKSRLDKNEDYLKFLV